MYIWKKKSLSQFSKRTFYALIIGSLFGTNSAIAADEESKNRVIKKYEGSAIQELREEVPLFQLIRQKSQLDSVRFSEVERKKLKGINTDKMDLSKYVDEDDKVEEVDKSRTERVPTGKLLSGTGTFEFYDIKSSRSFQMETPLDLLAKYSRSLSGEPDQSNPSGRKADEEQLKLEEQVSKAWSNANDSRTRRAIADGYSDTNSIYQRLANYGGCSATVLSANSSRMVAITAAHCVFATQTDFNFSTIDPRRNSGVSPTWGTWRPVGFGYYPGYLNNNCEGNWRGSRCIKHDIALVIAVPNSGASAPSGMGWGYRSKSWLGGVSKYRRGYPGCSFTESPSGCVNNNLYGDGSLSIGPLAHKVNGWNRQMRHSSDMNRGDSGSSLYYYRNGFPYVFAINSAEKLCRSTCTGTYPNYSRRITPDFFDFINDVVN